MGLKILHVWEVAGVASTLSRHLAPLGYDCKVICSDKGDPFGFTENHINHSKPLTAVLLIAEAIKYDLLHIHFHDELLPLLRRVYPLKPMVMHYHGSDIRGKDRSQFHRHADAILYSTRDLRPYLPDYAEFLPNPVENCFCPGADSTIRDCAVHFSYGADDLAEKIAGKYGLPLVIVKKPIPHREMPTLLHNYTHLVEAKRKDGREIMGSVEDTGSLLSLEALASGLTVLCRDGERRGLPQEHQASVVAERVAHIYEELME